MVDEIMRAVWGRSRRYTQKDADDHIKRTKQMLAKVGDPDSSVDNRQSPPVATWPRWPSIASAA